MNKFCFIILIICNSCWTQHEKLENSYRLLYSNTPCIMNENNKINTICLFNYILNDINIYSYSQEIQNYLKIIQSEFKLDLNTLSFNLNEGNPVSSSDLSNKTIFISERFLERYYNHIGAKYLEQGHFDFWPFSRVSKFWDIYRKFNPIDSNFNFIYFMDILNYDYTAIDINIVNDRLKNSIEFLILHEIYHIFVQKDDDSILKHDNIKELKADSFAIVNIINKANEDALFARTIYKDCITLFDFIADFATRVPFEDSLNANNLTQRHINISKILLNYPEFFDFTFTEKNIKASIYYWTSASTIIKSNFKNIKLLKSLQGIDFNNPYTIESFEFTISNMLETKNFVGLERFLIENDKYINLTFLKELTYLVLYKINILNYEFNKASEYMIKSKIDSVFLSNELKDLLLKVEIN